MKRNLLYKSPSSSLPALNPVIITALLLLALFTAACGDIAVRDNVSNAVPPANPTPASVGNTTHDLGIMGVDFDPGLDAQSILEGQQVTMVVGIENLGTAREKHVRVKASLWDADQHLVLARAEQVVDSVAAGDVVPARLVTDDTPPIYSQYKLVVEIEPVAKETDTANNSRTLDVTVNTN